MSNHNFNFLATQIIAMSKADNWHDAKSEWNVSTIYRATASSECLCTHSPIKEICVIENPLTGHEAEVGNVCVKKFMGLDAPSRMFNSLKRVEQRPEAALSPDVIKWAFKHKWISR